tara:strand:- start:323 stop:541 length:219 start_codon:yes stop_codon:yes gene_type:complete
LKQSKKFLVLTGIAIQMGVTVFLGAYLGKYLDMKYSFSKKWFTMLFTILSIGISIYFLLRQLKRINEQDHEK